VDRIDLIPEPQLVVDTEERGGRTIEFLFVLLSA
jgi:hypothetical protein